MVLVFTGEVFGAVNYVYCRHLNTRYVQVTLLVILLEKETLKLLSLVHLKLTFTGTFETTFTGNFIGALINAGTETIETYTLYVRTA